MKPESGCSGPPPRQTALSAPESAMKHHTTRHLPPMLTASIAGGVDLHGRRKPGQNASSIRLFRG